MIISHTSDDVNTSLLKHKEMICVFQLFVSFSYFMYYDSLNILLMKLLLFTLNIKESSSMIWYSIYIVLKKKRFLYENIMLQKRNF